MYVAGKICCYVSERYLDFLNYAVQSVVKLPKKLILWTFLFRFRDISIDDFRFLMLVAKNVKCVSEKL